MTALYDAPQEHYKRPSAKRNIAVDFGGKLDSGELLSGSPTVAELTTSDLTNQGGGAFGSDAQINTVALTINDRVTAIGEAVQFSVAGGTANTMYSIKVTVTTDASPAQTLIAIVRLQVIED